MLQTIGVLLAAIGALTLAEVAHPFHYAALLATLPAIHNSGLDNFDANDPKSAVARLDASSPVWSSPLAQGASLGTTRSKPLMQINMLLLIPKTFKN